jgi:hypothetical protein
MKIGSHLFFILLCLSANTVLAREGKDVFLRNGMVYRCVAIDTLGDQAIITMTSQIDTIKYESVLGVELKTYGAYKKSVLEPMSNIEREHYLKIADTKMDPQFDVEIKTVQGVSYYGKFIRSDDTSAIYATSNGDVTLKKSDILSATKYSNNGKTTVALSKPGMNNVAVKEYKRLPLLALAIGGGIGAYALFNKASDYSYFDKGKSKTYTWMAVGVTTFSVFIFIQAITPTVTILERPVAIIPTAHGISFSIKI